MAPVSKWFRAAEAWFVSYSLLLLSYATGAAPATCRSVLKPLGLVNLVALWHQPLSPVPAHLQLQPAKLCLHKRYICTSRRAASKHGFAFVPLWPRECTCCEFRESLWEIGAVLAVCVVVLRLFSADCRSTGRMRERAGFLRWTNACFCKAEVTASCCSTAR